MYLGVSYLILRNSRVCVRVNQLKVWKEVGQEMEKPESPHDWVTNDVLHIPELKHLNLGLIEVRHPLKNLHELHPCRLYTICLELVFRNVPADINEEAVRQ